MTWSDEYIAIDWGTTNRRAYRVDRSGRLTDHFADDLGAVSVPAGGFVDAIAAIRARLGNYPMLLAGMIGSNRGWRETPYVACPAEPHQIARTIVWIEPGRTGIVPGVCQHEPADVMRGEEVQVIGALAAGGVAENGLVCHPGTHAKWVRLDSGRIASIRTSMTGEVFSLLREHSILADQLRGSVAAGPEFIRGVHAALDGAPPLAALFGVRARHLLGQAHGSQAAYASGLLIGGDVAGMLAGGPTAERITLIGQPDLCDLYAAALRAAGRESRVVDGAAAFLAGIARLKEHLP